MSNYNIAIRADGNAKTGTGHIHRTMALAGYLKDDFHITFYLQNSDQFIEDLIKKNHFHVTRIKDEKEFLEMIKERDIVVLDGYNFDKDYQRSIMDKGNKLVVIDDMKQGIQIADVVFNHGYTGNEKDYGISETTLLCSGPEYVIVKNEFLNASSGHKKNSTDKLLICIGGTDPNNYSEKIISELLNKTNKKISLITYPINPNFEKLKQIAQNNASRLKVYHSLSTEEMSQLIQQNDIAILQPSNIAYEAACIGIYMALIKTEENQKYILDTLLKKGCAGEIGLNRLSETINAITIDDINQQISHQRAIFDNKSRNRILSVFNSLLLKPRLATEKDAEILFEWSNDKVTRENSYNQSKIDHASHLIWFGQKLKDKNCCFLMFDWKETPAGTVRIDVKETETVIGINISPNFRDKKLSVPMLRMACGYFFTHFKEKEITAYIKKNNQASLKSFLNSGFVIIDQNIYFETESYKLKKTK